MPALTIQLENIHRTKTSKNGKRLPILSSISLKIAPGSIIGICGPSGSGKSTLLRIMNRLEDPDHGSVRYGNIDMLNMDPIILRRKIAMVAQKPIMFPGTVADNIMLADTLTGLGNGNREKAQTLLETMQLPVDGLDRNATELSVGQQARVQLARILYMAPDVIMLDETTAHLDMHVSTLILDELEMCARRDGNTLIHVSHEKAKLQRADLVLFLNKKCIAVRGSPDDVLNNPQVATASLVAE